MERQLPPLGDRQRYPAHEALMLILHMFSRMVTVAILCFALAGNSYGQHCPPIGSSYLTEMSLKSFEKDMITLRLEHFKSGGRPKNAYQFYLLAYLDKNASELPSPVPEGQRSKYGDEMFDEKLAVVLDTRLVEKNEAGFYEYELTLNSHDMAKQFALELLVDQKKIVDGGWGRVDAQIRLAVFVPFLEDERYAKIEGLPEDRHECNYSNDRALLWQQLPYRLSVHFFEFGDDKPADERKQYHLQVNGDQRKSTSY